MLKYSLFKNFKKNKYDFNQDSDDEWDDEDW